MLYVRRLLIGHLVYSLIKLIYISLTVKQAILHKKNVNHARTHSWNKLYKAMWVKLLSQGNSGNLWWGSIYYETGTLRYFITTGILPPPVFYHHQYFTTTSILPPPVFYHHRYFTTTSILPPPVFYHHRYFTTTSILSPPVNPLVIYL